MRGGTLGYQPISVTSVNRITGTHIKQKVPCLSGCWALFTLSSDIVFARCDTAPLRQCQCAAGSCLVAASRTSTIPSDRHHGAGRADLVSVQAPLAPNPHLLERVLQLRSVHRLPGTHHPWLEVSDPLHPAADHLGLLRPAVLPAGGQQHGRTLQENVSLVSEH